MWPKVCHIAATDNKPNARMTTLCSNVLDENLWAGVCKYYGGLERLRVPLNIVWFSCDF